MSALAESTEVAKYLRHVSPSSLNRFLRCPENWRQRYLLDKPDPAGSKALVGSAFDKSFGDYYTARIGGGPGLELDAIQDSFRDNLLNEADTDTYVLDEDDTAGEMIDKSLPLVAAYLPVAQSMPDPIAVQQRVEIVHHSLPLPVIGFIDVRFVSSLTDTKLAANRSFHPDWHLPLRIYSAAESVPADVHIITKTKVPAVYTGADGDEYTESWSAAKAARTLRLVGQTIAQIESMLVMFGADSPWPTLPGLVHTWSCGKCPYKKGCPAWA